MNVSLLWTVLAFCFQREGCGKLEASDLLALIPFLYCLRSAAHLSDAPASGIVLEMVESAVCRRAMIHGCNSCSLPNAALQLPPFLHHRLSPHPPNHFRDKLPWPFIYMKQYLRVRRLGALFVQTHKVERFCPGQQQHHFLLSVIPIFFFFLGGGLINC